MNSFTTSFKVLAIVALLSTISINAMERNASVTPAAPVVVVVTESIAAGTKEIEKKGCHAKGSICKAWTNLSNAVSAKKNEIVAAANEMKARGWNQWTNKEKAGVVIGGTVVDATAAYLVYKVYKSLTAPKAKVQRSPRA